MSDYSKSFAESQVATNQYIIDGLLESERTYTAEEWQRKMEVDRSEYYAADHCSSWDPETGTSHTLTYEEWLEGKKAEEEWWKDQHPEAAEVKGKLPRVTY